MASVLFFSPAKAFAQEEKLIFLPTEPVFDRLIGDPRESQNSLQAQLTYPRFDGSIGADLGLLQWRPKDGSRWGWGIEGDSFLELGSLGNAVFPERVSDWVLGMVFSESAGLFSNRLEYVHVSSHLGDALFEEVPRIIYTRESFRFTTSFKPSDQWRLYLGVGYYPHLAPAEPRYFAHAGMEIYSQPFRFLAGTSGKGYFTYDVKLKQEAGGTINQNFEAGFQWKWNQENSQSIRMAVIYYNGDSEYGQFYRQNDNHWSLGIFFDP